MLVKHPAEPTRQAIELRYSLGRPLQISITGAGNIRDTLAPELVAAGHAVSLADSRGAEEIGATLTTSGGRMIVRKNHVYRSWLRRAVRAGEGAAVLELRHFETR